MLKKLSLSIYALAALFMVSLVPTAAKGDIRDRLFDFTDTYYRQNGVDPAKIQGRRQGVAPLGTIDNPFFSYQRNVRALLTLPGYDHSGQIQYWTVMGDLFVDGFINNRSGTTARQIADNMPLYVFPTRTGDQIGLGNNRQADILDMRHGYFSNNPLGLWIHVWVSYTDRAFNSRDGLKALADLQRRNGTALDGTPIIKTLSELENLFSKGFAVKRFRNPNGSEGPMYGICPVTKDPRDFGIALDQFLANVKRPDGTSVEPDLVTNFISLQNTGEWAN